MSSCSSPSRRLARSASVVCALFASPFLAGAAMAGPVASADARPIGDGACFDATPNAGTSGSSSLSVSSAELSTSMCFASANADAGNGSLHVFASAAGTANKPPGSQFQVPEMLATGRASLREQVRAQYSQSPIVLGASIVAVPVSIFVGGSVSAGSSDKVALPTADISYSATVQNQTISGTKHADNGGSSQGGDWSATTPFLVLIDTTNNLFSLSMQATAVAGIGTSSTVWPQGASASSTADFTHTLIWMGITGPLQAFNATGGQVSLPGNFTVDLFGVDTGYNYRFSAMPSSPPSNPGTVPLPGSLALVLGGLGAFLIKRRRGAQ